MFFNSSVSPDSGKCKSGDQKAINCIHYQVRELLHPSYLMKMDKLFCWAFGARKSPLYWQVAVFEDGYAIKRLKYLKVFNLCLCVIFFFRINNHPPHCKDRSQRLVVEGKATRNDLLSSILPLLSWLSSLFCIDPSVRTPYAFPFFTSTPPAHHAIVFTKYYQFSSGHRFKCLL